MEKKVTVPKTYLVVFHTTEDGEELYWGFGELLPLEDQMPKMCSSTVEAELEAWDAWNKTGLKCEYKPTTLEELTKCSRP